MTTAIDIIGNATPVVEGFVFDGIAVYAHNEIVDLHKTMWAGEFYGAIGFSNVTEFIDSFKCWCDEQGTWVPVIAIFGNSLTGQTQYALI